MTHVSG
jgi:predicted kinase